MLRKLNKDNKGFTIIEVLIVLAIAGLIMLVVFLAVPALQRNQRNTGRRSDAGRIAAAVNTYSANNNGAVPSTVPHLDEIRNDAGAFSQYPAGLTSRAAVPSAASQLAVVAGTATGFVPYNFDSFAIVTNAVCGVGSTAGTIATSTGAPARGMVLIYAQETSTGFSNNCQSI